MIPMLVVILLFIIVGFGKSLFRNIVWTTCGLRVILLSNVPVRWRLTSLINVVRVWLLGVVRAILTRRFIRLLKSVSNRLLLIMVVFGVIFGMAIGVY